MEQSIIDINEVRNRIIGEFDHLLFTRKKKMIQRRFDYFTNNLKRMCESMAWYAVLDYGDFDDHFVTKHATRTKLHNELIEDMVKAFSEGVIVDGELPSDSD